MSELIIKIGDASTTLNLKVFNSLRKELRTAISLNAMLRASYDTSLDTDIRGAILPEGVEHTHKEIDLALSKVSCSITTIKCLLFDFESNLNSEHDGEYARELKLCLKADDGNTADLNQDLDSVVYDPEDGLEKLR